MFLLAAKISAITMNKAVALARTEAERKIEGAALARKRAKEAIDHFVFLSSKMVHSKQQRRDVVLGSGPSLSPRNVALGSGPRPYSEATKSDNNGVGRVGIGNGNRSLAAVPVVQSNGGTNGKENAV